MPTLMVIGWVFFAIMVFAQALFNIEVFKYVTKGRLKYYWAIPLLFLGNSAAIAEYIIILNLFVTQ
jgi:hypothetical protein